MLRRWQYPYVKVYTSDNKLKGVNTMSDKFVPTVHSTNVLVKHFLAQMVAHKTLKRFANDTLVPTDEKVVLVNNRIVGGK